MDTLFGLTEEQRVRYRDMEQCREYWEREQAPAASTDPAYSSPSFAPGPPFA